MIRSTPPKVAPNGVAIVLRRVFRPPRQGQKSIAVDNVHGTGCRVSTVDPAKGRTECRYVNGGVDFTAMRGRWANCSTPLGSVCFLDA